ncbi:MAG: thiamine-phosphate kinase [Micropepsaceae bacterium]
MSGEFDIIARHFAPLAKDTPLAFGLKDDAAMLAPPGDHRLVVTADAIVEGVHFLHDDPPNQIAQKLLRVNLSDLAAKGATPLGYLLTCAFPPDIGERWIAAFARGLKADQKHFGLNLLGGDTVSTPGPATFSVTMFGAAKGRAMLRRAGAKPGDLLCVTGTIGDGGLGLTELLKPHAGLSASQRRFLIARYRLPQPRNRIGPLLHGIASAALDVSDGLVQDVEHLAKQSGVRAVIDLASVPLSPAARALEKTDPDIRHAAIGAGDDYEIAFTVPPKRLKSLKSAAEKSRIRVTIVGRVEKGAGVAVALPDGSQISPERGGFDHFAR